MKRSPHDRRIHALSIFFAAVPFAFALIRAVRTGYDLRYLWVALASLCGAIVVMAVAKPNSRTPNASVVLMAGVFIISTLLAVLAALPLGTTLGPGILLVASGFGFCFGVGCVLHVLARP